MTNCPRIVVIGNSAVGKTSLINRIMHDTFDTNAPSTTGAGYCAYHPENSKHKEIQIWDTAGMERFRGMNKAYYREAVAALLVFDLTNQESFSDLESWLADFKENCTKEHIVFLVGNKSDLEGQVEVTETDLNWFLQRHPEMRFFRTSAATGSGVKEMFSALINVLPYSEPISTPLEVVQGKCWC